MVSRVAHSQRELSSYLTVLLKINLLRRSYLRTKVNLLYYKEFSLIPKALPQDLKIKEIMEF